MPAEAMAELPLPAAALAPAAGAAIPGATLVPVPDIGRAAAPAALGAACAAV
jgi:hypothetical protein